jgi:hypothetical protein
MKLKSDTVVSDLLTASQEVRAERQRELERARVEGKAQADAEAKEIEERTARLRALRLAKEADDARKQRRRTLAAARRAKKTK